MADHNDTGATARPWRDTGDRILLPDGRQLIGSVITDPAIRWMIVEAVNAYEPLKTSLAEVERERDEWKQAAGVEAQLRREFLTKANAAEARVAVLERALESIRQYGSDTLSGRADGGSDDRQWQREAVREMTRRARTALAAEQKEAGK